MTDHQLLVVTTSLKASSATQQHAATSAAEWGIPYVSRDKRGIEALLPDEGAALVFSNTELHLATAAGRLRSHLGTAYIRLLSLDRGDGDPLVRAGDLRAGDRVLDTTYGLGRDAIVAARAVGPTGMITAVESSTALYYLADSALSSARGDARSAPTVLHHGDAVQLLSTLEDNSADVVLVDPMFSTPKTSDAGFALLRTVADMTPLTQQWIQHARRVASRWVVLKTGAPLPWFSAESLERVHSHSNASWFRAPSSVD